MKKHKITKIDTPKSEEEERKVKEEKQFFGALLGLVALCPLVDKVGNWLLINSDYGLLGIVILSLEPGLVVALAGKIIDLYYERLEEEEKIITRFKALLQEAIVEDEERFQR